MCRTEREAERALGALRSILADLGVASRCSGESAGVASARGGC
jgi:hypothetical protein